MWACMSKTSVSFKHSHLHIIARIEIAICYQRKQRIAGDTAQHFRQDQSVEWHIENVGDAVAGGCGIDEIEFAVSVQVATDIDAGGGGRDSIDQSNRVRLRTVAGNDGGNTSGHDIGDAAVDRMFRARARTAQTRGNPTETAEREAKLLDCGFLLRGKASHGIATEYADVARAVVDRRDIKSRRRGEIASHQVDRFRAYIERLGCGEGAVAVAQQNMDLVACGIRSEE